MSKNGKFNRRAWETSLGEVRQGAIKYVEAMANAMEATVDASDPMAVAKNMIYMGYAVGVIAGKSSDVGIEGFTLLLNGIKISLTGEQRKEMMQFAIWDKGGDLHTSEEGFYTKEGGEK